MTGRLGPNSPAGIRSFSRRTAQRNCEFHCPRARGNSCASPLTIWGRHRCLSPGRSCTRRAQPRLRKRSPITIKSRDESPGTTRLALDLGAANLTLGSLRIESNEPVFTRAVTLAVPEVGDDGIRERNIADAVIYRVNVNGKNEAHLEIPLESQIHTRELFVLIRNEDSPPTFD